MSGGYVSLRTYEAVVKELDDAIENINLKAEFIEKTLNDMAALGAENYELRKNCLQPIETAPKDGTRFLGWHPDSEIYEREQIKETWMGKAPKGSPNYQKWLDGEIALNTGWEYFENDCVYKWNPTHWMPLPDPPKQTAA